MKVEYYADQKYSTEIFYRTEAWNVVLAFIKQQRHGEKSRNIIK